MKDLLSLCIMKHCNNDGRVLYFQRYSAPLEVCTVHIKQCRQSCINTEADLVL